MGAMKYVGSCVNWPQDKIYGPGGLNEMIEGARDVTRRTFLRHVDRGDLAAVAALLQYQPHPKQGLTMAADWAISYHRSKVFGKRCYYFRWSAIEFVFA